MLITHHERGWHVSSQTTPSDVAVGVLAPRWREGDFDPEVGGFDSVIDEPSLDSEMDGGRYCSCRGLHMWWITSNTFNDQGSRFCLILYSVKGATSRQSQTEWLKIDERHRCESCHHRDRGNRLSGKRSVSKNRQGTWDSDNPPTRLRQGHDCVCLCYSVDMTHMTSMMRLCVRLSLLPYHCVDMTHIATVVVYPYRHEASEWLKVI